MVTDSSACQPVPGQKATSNGHISKLTVDINFGFTSCRIIRASNMSPFIWEKKEIDVECFLLLCFRTSSLSCTLRHIVMIKWSMSFRHCLLCSSSRIISCFPNNSLHFHLLFGDLVTQKSRVASLRNEADKGEQERLRISRTKYEEIVLIEKLYWPVLAFYPL